MNVDQYERTVAEVYDIYAEAERAMMTAVAKRVAKGVTQPGWTEKKYAEMQQVTNALADMAEPLYVQRQLIEEHLIAEAYDSARGAFFSDARQFSRASFIDYPNFDKVTNIILELDSAMNAADRRILRAARDEYAAIVGRTSALVATGAITYREAVKRELADFAKKGITSFVDKAGRNWDMATYAEMATLTAIERATREGYFDAMRENGYDLVQIDDHYGSCPICEAWEGVVLSISGNTPGYQTVGDAEKAGVFHPRCMHDLGVYYPGYSRGARLNPRPVQPASAGYTARSKQREYERRIRQYKRQMAVATSAADERAAYAKVREYQAKIRDLIDEYNETTDQAIDRLPRKYWREGGRQTLSAAAKGKQKAQEPKPITPLQRAEKQQKQFDRAASGGARRFLREYTVRDAEQSRQDILEAFRRIDAAGGIKINFDADGNFIGGSCNKQAMAVIDELIPKLMSRMRVEDPDAKARYSEWYTYFRTRTFFMPKQDRADIADFSAYARSKDSFVRVTTDTSRTSINQLYQDISETNPDLFPPEVRTQSEQLMQINSALASLRDRREVPVLEYYGDDIKKALDNDIFSNLMGIYWDATYASGGVSRARRKQ